MNSQQKETRQYEKRWEKLQESWKKKGKFAKFFHLAKTSARNEILQKGIVPHSLRGPVIFYENRVFLLTDKSKLYEIQEMTGKHTCQMDLWEIDNSKLNLKPHLDEFAKNSRCCYVNEKIPKESIRLVKTIEPYFE